MTRYLPYVFLAFSLCVFGCSKSENKIDIPKTKPEPEQNVKKVKAEYKITSFAVVDRDADQLYPGKIVKMQGEGDEIQKIDFNDYKKLPVIISSALKIQDKPSYKDIPDFMKIETYLLNNTRFEGDASASFSGWNAMLDHHALSWCFTDKQERARFFKLLADYKTVKTTMATTNEVKNFDFTMDLPDKDALISEEDIRKANDENLCYVSAAYYGRRSVMLVQSEAEEKELRAVLKKLADRESLSAAEGKLLDVTSLAVYVRTSAQKDALMEKASGKNKILALYNKTVEFLDQKYANHIYPISYHLRKLSDFSGFYTSFDYEYDVIEE